MADETSIAFAWIIATLSNDAELQGYAPGGVTRRFAQPRTTTPYVVMTYKEGDDNPVFGGANAYSNLLVEVVAEGPAATMQNIVNAAARIKQLLTVAEPLAVTGGSIRSCYRSQPIETDPLVDGEQWTSLGGIYRIIAIAS